MSFKDSALLIDAACSELDYVNGDLVNISDENGADFIEKGDWIRLCEQLDESLQHNVTKLFFVNEEPLIVFSKSDVNESLFRIYNKVWCMARPRLFFLETPTELLVFDLANRPARSDEELLDNALVVVKDALEIRTKMNRFRREQVESGRTFEDACFTNIEFRADRALIRDLKIVRNKLSELGLFGQKLKYAHALIGKSIFIRYLEDRGIITQSYFDQIADKNLDWQKKIHSELRKPNVNPDVKQSYYAKVLGDKAFTYAVFEKIKEDFNGDIFPTDEQEQEIVNDAQLIALQRFLLGDVDDNSLFFWAYRFDIIPIELISNIYEEFYHFNNKEASGKLSSKSGDNKGTYYTPAPLVEFVLRKVLTIEYLEKKPIVMDPSCGSGIFLVETYRRIVRYQLYLKQKRNLTRKQLLAIIKHQIRGIELNEEALKITAFSLYLAFLHYQSPPDILTQIRKGQKLPHLIAFEEKTDKEEFFDILLHSNAFSTNDVKSESISKKFGDKCADIIIGNPPWGSPAKADIEGRASLKKAIDWCHTRGYALSDKELSQAFLWRAKDFLRENGMGAMLVSSGILFKQSEKSNLFKQQWINSISLCEVVNFIHVRDVFFNGAISPFLSIVFRNIPPELNFKIDYWTARRTKIIENTKSVFLDKTDFKFISFTETKTNDIWKIFYFGNHRDLSLINRLRLFPNLESLEAMPQGGRIRRQGFIEGNRALPSDWLLGYKELPASSFSDRYAEIKWSKVLQKIPDYVKERGAKEIYDGERLLIGKVSQRTNPKGQLIVRLEDKKFAFRNTINCIRLKEEYKRYYKVVLGILWSSLSRYYFFMTCSKWGVWHDQVYAEEILGLPISLPQNKREFDRICSIVDQLYQGKFIDNSGVEVSDLFSERSKHMSSLPLLKDLENELDTCIFQLYKLSNADVDLINDRCNFDIDSFYNDSQSLAVSRVKNVSSHSGGIKSIVNQGSRDIGLLPYVTTFISLWNNQLEDGQQLFYSIIAPANSPLIGVIFSITETYVSESPILNVDEMWRATLDTLDSEMQTKYSTQIYIDGIVRILTENQIIVIKRNEMRLWSKTAAREDVDATTLQAIIKQEKINNAC